MSEPVKEETTSTRPPKRACSIRGKTTPNSSPKKSKITNGHSVSKKGKNQINEERFSDPIDKLNSHFFANILGTNVYQDYLQLKIENEKEYDIKKKPPTSKLSNYVNMNFIESEHYWEYVINAMINHLGNISEIYARRTDVEPVEPYRHMLAGIGSTACEQLSAWLVWIFGANRLPAQYCKTPAEFVTISGCYIQLPSADDFVLLMKKHIDQCSQSDQLDTYDHQLVNTSMVMVIFLSLYPDSDIRAICEQNNAVVVKYLFKSIYNYRQSIWHLITAIYSLIALQFCIKAYDSDDLLWDKLMTNLGMANFFFNIKRLYLDNLVDIEFDDHINTNKESRTMQFVMLVRKTLLSLGPKMCTAKYTFVTPDPRRDLQSFEHYLCGTHYGWTTYLLEQSISDMILNGRPKSGGKPTYFYFEVRLLTLGGVRIGLRRSDKDQLDRLNCRNELSMCSVCLANAQLNTFYGVHVADQQVLEYKYTKVQQHYSHDIHETKAKPHAGSTVGCLLKMEGAHKDANYEFRFFLDSFENEFCPKVKGKVLKLENDNSASGKLHVAILLEAFQQVIVVLHSNYWKLFQEDYFQNLSELEKRTHNLPSDQSHMCQFACDPLSAPVDYYNLQPRTRSSMHCNSMSSEK